MNKFIGELSSVWLTVLPLAIAGCSDLPVADNRTENSEKEDHGIEEEAAGSPAVVTGLHLSCSEQHNDPGSSEITLSCQALDADGQLVEFSEDLEFVWIIKSKDEEKLEYTVEVGDNHSRSEVHIIIAKQDVSRAIIGLDFSTIDDPIGADLDLNLEVPNVIFSQLKTEDTRWFAEDKTLTIGKYVSKGSEVLTSVTLTLDIQAFVRIVSCTDIDDAQIMSRLYTDDVVISFGTQAQTFTLAYEHTVSAGVDGRVEVPNTNSTLCADAKNSAFDIRQWGDAAIPYGYDYDTGRIQISEVKTFTWTFSENLEDFEDEDGDTITVETAGTYNVNGVATNQAATDAYEKEASLTINYMFNER